MLLSIITKESNKYKKAIEAACKFCKLEDYEILDPKFNDLTMPLAIVLYIGNDFKNLIPCVKSWSFDHYPTSDLPANIKMELVGILKEAKEYMDNNKTPDRVRSADVPPIKTLYSFLNNLTGRVVEIKLPDRRKLGIYPDNTKPMNKYDIEFNASTIVNLAKLFNLFDASEIVIKEI